MSKINLKLVISLMVFSFIGGNSVYAITISTTQKKIADPVTPNELGLVDLSGFGLSFYCPSGKVIETILGNSSSGVKGCSGDTLPKAVVDQLIKLKKDNIVLSDRVKTLESLLENQSELITDLQTRVKSSEE